LDVKTVRVVIALAIIGGVVYAFFLGGVVYAIAFIVALLVWALREAIWWRGSGYRGSLIKYFWGPDKDWRRQGTKK
jgi:hypothetical protein